MIGIHKKQSENFTKQNFIPFHSSALNTISQQPIFKCCLSLSLIQDSLSRICLLKRSISHKAHPNCDESKEKVLEFCGTNFLFLSLYISRENFLVQYTRVNELQVNRSKRIRSLGFDKLEGPKNVPNLMRKKSWPVFVTREKKFPLAPQGKKENGGKRKQFTVNE